MNTVNQHGTVCVYRGEETRAVGRGRQQVVWILAACAALAAQVAPRAFCGGCDQPCCASHERDGCAATAETAALSAGGCPLCAVAVVPSPCNDADQPCRCQLDARPAQPISAASGSSFPSFDPADQAVVSVADRPDVPVVAGVSREFLAAVRASPIRPARILYGVWLN